MDYMNNPTEREKQIARKTAEAISAWIAGDPPMQEWEIQDISDAILAAIQDAQQQGNEDSALLVEHLEILTGELADSVAHQCDFHEIDASQWWKAVLKTRKILAARGVQPAAKESYSDVRQEIRQAIRPEIDAIRDSETLTADDLSVRIGAAQQESAPAAEQQLIKGRCNYCGEPCNEAMCIYCDTQNPFRESAPSPAQDKPVAASVEKLWADWWKRNGFGIGICEKAMERAFKSAFAISASSPSEQKSSLPAETLSAQEQESQETGQMITYVRTTPMPRCRYCGKQMDFWIPGLSDSQHAHDECEGKAMAARIWRNLSPDAPRPSGTSVALPKSDSAASAAIPKEKK
jgi:hypothetical protein